MIGWMIVQKDTLTGKIPHYSGVYRTKEIALTELRSLNMYYPYKGDDAHMNPKLWAIKKVSICISPD